MKQLFTFILILSLPIMGIAQNKQYTDLSIFWKDFKNAAIKKDNQKISELTSFPFAYQGGFETSKDDFNKLLLSGSVFSADIIKATYSAPK